MDLQLISLIFIFIKFSMAQQTFWGNNGCYSSNDCSTFRQCDRSAGCVLSFWPLFMVLLAIFVKICALLIYCCRRRRHNGVVLGHMPTSTVNTNSNPYQSGERLHATEISDNIGFVPEDNPPSYSEAIKTKENSLPTQIQQLQHRINLD